MLTPVVRTILFLNIIVFILESYNPGLIYQFGLRSFLSPDFNPVQLITHMFMHAGFMHIFSNMIGLIIFAPMLERVWGPRRFTFFYFFTGIGAALLFSGINYFESAGMYDAARTYPLNPSPDAFMDFITRYASGLYDQVSGFMEQYEAQPNNPALIDGSIKIVNTYFSRQVYEPMVGASGAIFGIIMAFGMLFPNTQLFLLFPPIPIKAKYLVIFYGAYELYSGIYRSQASNVAHFAHIGGMLFAFILIKYWGSQRKTFY
ncbi:rhomboid family intramembrane serine protease [Nibrella viscosa]